jgi:hypothetical protein
MPTLRDAYEIPSARIEEPPPARPHWRAGIGGALAGFALILAGALMAALAWGDVRQVHWSFVVPVVAVAASLAWVVLRRFPFAHWAWGLLLVPVACVVFVTVASLLMWAWIVYSSGA